MECRTVLVTLGGRFWEIGDSNSTGENKPVDLPTSDGGTWWRDNQQSGAYESGQTPKLGAVICFSDNYGGSGHVAIVEEIDANGNIVCSNSAWQGTFFFLTNISQSNNYNWSHYTFQGFIYNPHSDDPTPPTKTKNWWKYKKKGIVII